jgi:hypothetical protein
MVIIYFIKKIKIRCNMVTGTKTYDGKKTLNFDEKKISKIQWTSYTLCFR